MRVQLRQLLIITLIICAISISGCSCESQDNLWHEADKTPATPAVLTPTTFTQIAKQQKPAVVNISTTRIIKDHPNLFSDPFSRRTPRDKNHGFGNRWGRKKPFEDFFDQFFGGIPRRQFKQKSLGTGFIINKDGYILTNNHVVENVDEIKITLSNQKEFEAKVVGKDPKTDIALIKIDSWKELPIVNLGDSDKLEVGEWVIAIGNPFGLEHTVTSGIVSAKGRVLGAGPYDDYIQTDASINPGNSGGPLFNLRGEVIGINTAIIPEGQGIGFALPINLVKEILEDLKEKGEVTRGWLGLVIQKVTPGLAKSFGLDEPVGALVSEVVPGSPAKEAGLQQGDIVTEFNDEKIENYSELSREAAKSRPGAKLKLKVLRNGKEKELTVIIGTFPKDERHAYMTGKVSSRLGMQVENITQQLQNYFALEDNKGVVITKVEPDSPAEEAKIKAGSVIVSMNKQAVPDVDTYRKILAGAKPGDTLLLLLKQGTRTVYLTITVP